MAVKRSVLTKTPGNGLIQNLAIPFVSDDPRYSDFNEHLVCPAVKMWLATVA